MNLYESYCLDLGTLVRETAMDARERHQKQNTDFSSGYLMGMYRIITLMQQQAEAFGMPLEAINLDGLDPDEDLISPALRKVTKDPSS